MHKASKVAKYLGYLFMKFIIKKMYRTAHSHDVRLTREEK